MHGIGSLLDDDHYKMVEDIWAGLEEALDVRGVYVTPFPHFSYHVADHYDLERLEPLLQDFAGRTPPFEAMTTGLGIFTEGINPVLYVTVARSPELSAINGHLWSLLQAASTGIVGYYHPHVWVPHITLGLGDITRDNLAEAISVLSAWDFTWQIKIDNIVLLYSEGDTKRDRVQLHCQLSGQRAPPRWPGPG
ncbi:MAG: 2'-5' RNA ligase family protein [Anaerolineae bacterium]|nr:2'-5' RNA ligase family protein [Anaerolineae bacterium]